MIDWDSPLDHVSKYFIVKECLWLPRFNRMANDKDGLNETIFGNLIMLCDKLDEVRAFLGKPMQVHSMFRPYLYNEMVLGAKNSPHLKGEAVDFHCAGLNCDDGRTLLLPKLKEWGLRMEDLPGAAWIHLDNAPVTKERYFKP